ncbi:hypothetical protein [Lysobacter gummosus]|uniref:hypothetical protein n=1 Tax=Lysobacter gummosus TaxID=262324 RepID=UPI00363E83B6
MRLLAIANSIESWGRRAACRAARRINQVWGEPGYRKGARRAGIVFRWRPS